MACVRASLVPVAPSVSSSLSCPDFRRHFRRCAHDARTNSLPEQPTPLVGRDDVLATARTMLMQSDARLLTMVGPGGVVKTRLGLQLAADLGRREGSADSIILGFDQHGQPFRLAYQLAWDEVWRLREARLVVTGRTRHAVAAS